MMGWVVAFLASAAPCSVAMTNFSTVGDVKPDAASFLSETFAQKLAEHSNLKVTTAKNIGALVGLERQRELMGCDNNAGNCIAELAGAIGAQAVVVGEVARLERSLQVNLRVVNGKTSDLLFSTSVRGSTMDDIVDKLDDIATRAGAAIEHAFGGAPSAADGVAQSASSGVSVSRWLVVGAGALIAIVGAGLLIDAQVTSGRLGGTPTLDFTPGNADSAARLAGPLGTTGGVLIGVGVAVLVVGIVWRIVDPGGAPLAFSPPATSDTFAGAWP